MKQKLFTLFTTLLCSISMYAAATKVVYTVFDENNTLTYYYNTKYNSSNPYHELYDPVNNPNSRWDRYLGMTAAMTQVPVSASSGRSLIPANVVQPDRALYFSIVPNGTYSVACDGTSSQ